MARKKASPPSASRPEGGKPSACELLDELLPFAEPSENETHVGAAPTVALIDPGRADDLAEMLRRRGHTPRILKS
jgi:hypothetical protein